VKYQIWFSEVQQIGTFTEALDDEERAAFESELGFELQEEFESLSKEEAAQFFVDWCNTQRDAYTGGINKVERVNLVGTLKKLLENE
jgi:hypothetical protein